MGDRILNAHERENEAVGPDELQREEGLTDTARFDAHGPSLVWSAEFRPRLRAISQARAERLLDVPPQRPKSSATFLGALQEGFSSAVLRFVHPPVMTNPFSA